MIPPAVVRSQVVTWSRRLHAAGWVANHDGNVSARLAGDRLVITPTSVSKADVEDASLVICSMDGKVLEGRRKPPGELHLHLAAYRARKDAAAVIHAHPPTATAFGVAGASLDLCSMPEVVVSLGPGVPTVPFAMPKSKEADASVEACARERDAMLLAGNGALTLGDSLEQAYLRMELVEHFARIVLAARSLGGPRELGPEQIQALLQARKAAGLGPRPA